LRVTHKQHSLPLGPIQPSSPATKELYGQVHTQKLSEVTLPKFSVKGKLLLLKADLREF